MDHNFHETIFKLSKDNKSLELKKFLEASLLKSPNNTEIILRLSILELYPPFVNEENSIKLLEKLLALQSDNYEALILLAYIYEVYWTGINQELFEKLDMAAIQNNEILSMIERAKAWYYKKACWYDNQKCDLYEKLLLNSIKLCPFHVYNYTELANFYLKQNKRSEARKLLEIAIKNIKKIVPRNCELGDFTSINYFLNENMKGTHITAINAEQIYNILNQAKN